MEVPLEDTRRLERGLKCSVGVTPFVYLGLLIGDRMSRVEAWNPVIEKFKNKLREWKAKSMSFGGRLTLIKSVLGSLPLNYFSLFRVPMSVINSLENIRRNFFWGGMGESKKMSWVK